MLDIQLACPCRAVELMESYDAEQIIREKNVEMDPVSMICVQEDISKKGLKVAGWYISSFL